MERGYLADQLAALMMLFVFDDRARSTTKLNRRSPHRLAVERPSIIKFRQNAQ